MKERPILMSTPMVRAILSGRKTQTRRLVKPQSAVLTDEMARAFGVRPPEKQNTPVIACPLGTVGDRLWVRETWSETFTPGGASVVAYRAGGCIAIGRDTYDGPKYLLHILAWQGTPEPDTQGWRPSIHMPRWASRITLEITNVRVERLNEISEADAIAEGIEQTDPFFGCPCWRDYMEADPEASSFPDDPVGSYASLWESLHGSDSWEQNPWVWAIEFRRIDR